MSEKLLYIHSENEAIRAEQRIAIAESLGFVVTKLVDEEIMVSEAEEKLLNEIEHSEYAGVWLDVLGSKVTNGLSDRSVHIIFKNREVGNGVLGRVSDDDAEKLLVMHIGLPNMTGGDK